MSLPLQLCKDTLNNRSPVYAINVYNNQLHHTLSTSHSVEFKRLIITAIIIQLITNFQTSSEFICSSSLDTDAFFLNPSMTARGGVQAPPPRSH